MTKENFKSGFISIIGRPNVGKSTLMNTIVGEKVSIVADKPQTTRNQIRGVYNNDRCQMVFIDTPGLHSPKTKLGQYMVKSAKASLSEVEGVVVIVDVEAGIGVGDRRIVQELSSLDSQNIVMVINKIDMVPFEKLLSIIDEFKEVPYIDEIIPISALTGDGVDDLIKKLEDYLEVGPKFFPDDMYTDQPEMVIVTELIREKTLRLLRDEIPHGIGVEIISLKKRTNKDLIDIYADIVCEKASHKGIIIGKGGSMIGKIGTLARHDIEALFGSKINLQLHTRVREGWRNKDATLKDLGYDPQDI